MKTDFRSESIHQRITDTLRSIANDPKLVSEPKIADRSRFADNWQITAANQLVQHIQKRGIWERKWLRHSVAPLERIAKRFHKSEIRRKS
jgi:hypothetical protein